MELSQRLYMHMGAISSRIMAIIFTQFFPRQFYNNLQYVFTQFLLKN